jgi:tyramine---L-glutamate ligase
MKILIFEYATATGLKDPIITSEGNAMFEAILEDLKGFKPEYLVSEDYKISNSRAVPFEGNIKGWLNNHIHEYDACLPIMPEEDNLLYDITSIIEDNNVEVLGSNSNAVKLTTNKFDTYNTLKGKVPVIKTEKIYFNEYTEETTEHEFNQTLDVNQGIKKVVKPADGVSCSGVWIVNSYNKFIDAQNNIKKYTKLPYYLLQDYIKGVSVSVSLLCDGESAIPMSVNFQDININYNKINYMGGKVPYQHRLSNIAMETAKDAVESIDGLKGYVGVDMILDHTAEEVHLVEINSRITTPYIALRKIINFNLGEAIINSVHGKVPSEVVLYGSSKFYKEGKTLRVSVLK